ESAARIERREIVRAADMLAGDEDLGNRGAAMGAVDHLGAVRAAHRDVDLLIFGMLAVEQRLGAIAIGAEGLGVDFDLGHRGIHLWSRRALVNLRPLLPSEHAPS